MLKLGNTSSGGDGSFLPEDYLAKKARGRTNAVALTLFSVVTVGVIGAFFVTHRQWNDVRNYQEAINVRYSQAAKDIEQLKELESQKSQLLAKAELTTSLIEQVPRSILLAELVNRMPEEMTLLQMDLEAKRVKGTKKPAPDSSKGSSSLTSRTSKQAKLAGSTAAEVVIDAPRFDTSVTLIGVAPTHTLVAKYASNLQLCTLLEGVELRFSDKTEIQDREMYKFRLDCKIDPRADARELDPGKNPTLSVDSQLDGVISGVTVNAQEDR
jgi:hypothetical protein